MAEVEEDQRRKSKRTKKASGVGGKERWPTIKPKKDIQINRLKSTHLFTVFLLQLTLPNIRFNQLREEN